MASAMLGPLVLALLAQHGAAAVMAAPEAAITPAPALLKRAVTTIGYISTREFDGTTYWDTITANEQGNAIATSSNLFQICDPAKPCTFFSCSGDYVILSTSSLFCGGSSSTCSYWELKTDINDQNPLTNYWCDAKTSSGGVIYMTTPEAGAGSATGTTKTSAKPVSVSFASASNVRSVSSIDPEPGLDPSDSSSSSSETSSKKKKSTPIGAIVGGVVGGIGVLAAIIFGVWFFLRKKRNQSAPNNTVQQAPPGPPPMQQNAQQPPAGVQYYHEQKPVPQPQVQQVPPQPYGQQAPAQPFYDPNAQPAYAQQSQAMYGAPAPEKTPAPLATGHQTHSYYADNGPVSPVPQYSPSPAPAVPANVNELSSERM